MLVYNKYYFGAPGTDTCMIQHVVLLMLLLCVIPLALDPHIIYTICWVEEEKVVVAMLFVVVVY